MTDLAVQFTDNELSRLLGTLLRARTRSAKDLARQIGVDPRTADGYRSGRHLPPIPVFARMVGALGADLADAVLSPSAAHARLTAEIAAHEQAAAEARRLREALGGHPAGVASLPPEAEGVPP